MNNKTVDKEILDLMVDYGYEINHLTVTLNDASDWLREKIGVHIMIDYGKNPFRINKNEKPKWYGYLNDINRKYLDIDNHDMISDDTYEGCLRKSILEALRYIN